MSVKINLSKYLKKDKTYLLACSFGSDSMALCYLLLKGGYKFEVAYVNYNLRKESKDEEEGLKKYCQDNGLKLHIKEVEKNTIKGNIEGNCRVIRYDFFSSLCKEFSLEAILVAHHQEDLLETYLLQQERNSLYGYAGLRDISYYKGTKVIRPLLNLKKEDLLSIDKENNVPYLDDASNKSDTYKRNKIRHDVIEKMSETEKKSLLNEINYRNKLIKANITYLSKLDLNDVNVLLGLDRVRFANAMYLLLDKENIFYPISGKLCENIKNALLSTKPNIILPIGEDVIFEKSYGKVRFLSRNTKNQTNYIYVVDSPEILDTNNFYLDLFNFDKLQLTKEDYPLTIRNAREDDEVPIGDYTKKVSRLYIDYKMPLNVREIWPIFISASRGVIYFPRYRKDFSRDLSPYFYMKL